MDPVLATSNDHGLQEPRTPISTRNTRDIRTPVSGKKHECSDCPSSQKKSRFLSNTLKWFKSHKARVGDQNGSPRRKKSAWNIFATIRSPKLENEEFCQDVVEAERPRTTSPSKTSRGTIENESSQPKRRRSLSDILNSITKSPPTRRNTISRCSMSLHRSCLGKESMNNHPRTCDDVPLRFSSKIQRRIPTPIPQDESGEVGYEEINPFVSRTINVVDTFKIEQTERLSNDQKDSAYSSGSWKSQAQTLGGSYTSLSAEKPESVIHEERVGTPNSWLQELIAAHDLLSVKFQEESSGEEPITSQRYHRDQQPIVTIREVNPAWDLDIDPEFRHRLEQRTGRYQDFAVHEDSSPFLNEEEIAQSIKITVAKMTKNVHGSPSSDEYAGDFYETSRLVGDSKLDFEKDEIELWDAIILGDNAMQEKKSYQKFPTIPSDDGTNRISPILEQSIAFRTPAEDETVSDSGLAMIAKNTSFLKGNSIEDCRKPRPSVKYRYASVDPVFVKFPTTENSSERTKIYSSKSSAIADLYNKSQGQFGNLCTFDPKGRTIHVYLSQETFPSKEEVDQGGLEVLWLPLNGLCDNSIDDNESEEIPEWYMSTEDSISGDIDISRRRSLDLRLSDPLIDYEKCNAAERQARNQSDSNLIFDSSLDGKDRYDISNSGMSVGCGMSVAELSPSKDEGDQDADDRSTLGFLASQFSADSDDFLSQSSKQASLSEADITRLHSPSNLVCHLGDVQPEVASPTRTWPELGRAYLQAHPFQSLQERGDSDGETRKYRQRTCSTTDTFSSRVSEVSKGDSRTNDDTDLNPVGPIGDRKGKGLSYDFVNAEYLGWACSDEQRKEFGHDFLTTEYPGWVSGCSRPGPSINEDYFNCGVVTEKGTEAHSEDDPFTEHIEDISSGKRPIVTSYIWPTKQNLCLEQDLADSCGTSQTTQSQSPEFGSAGSKHESWKIHLPAITKTGGFKSTEDVLPTKEPSDPSVNVNEAIAPEQAGVEMGMDQAALFTSGFRFTKYGKHLEKAESCSRDGLLIRSRTPVTVEDLNIRAIGKAARNGSLSKRDKKVLALVDVFQAQGLMPSSLGILLSGPRRPPTVPQKPIDRPVPSLLPNVTPLALYGTACSPSEKRRVVSAGSRRSSGSSGSLRPIEQNLISPSSSSRACSGLSFAETEVSLMFGERLEKMEHH